MYCCNAEAIMFQTSQLKRLFFFEYPVNSKTPFLHTITAYLSPPSDTLSLPSNKVSFSVFSLSPERTSSHYTKLVHLFSSLSPLLSSTSAISYRQIHYPKYPLRLFPSSSSHQICNCPVSLFYFNF